ncbi:MAG: CpsB/CapC family capsule biosynthesis tyrosine phosphatase [Candidatus Dactylopiibacterium sp.]|nr:CpsB/CapC family capsule biosynthesis tyrosine phosphatase [Candidatus Dactylopiibacterium sp.]
MIDIHCHLLPGVDDGPATEDESLALARACVADGIRHVVATPHVFPGRFHNDRHSIAAASEAFAARLAEHGIPLGLSYGGEVRFSVELLDLLHEDRIPFLGECAGLRTMLLELPDALMPVGAPSLARHLVTLGVLPVLVHPERNKAIMEKPERAARLVDAGCCLQITAASIVGQFGPRVLAATDFLLREGWVSAVASDAHNLKGRPPRMREASAALTERFGARLAQELCVSGPARLCGRRLAVGQAAALTPSVPG